MTIHIVTDNGVNLHADKQAAVRKAIIDEMALNLVAAAAAGLDLTDQSEVTLYLFDARRYSQEALRFYTAAAVLAAQEIIVTAKMGERHA